MSLELKDIENALLIKQTFLNELSQTKIEKAEEIIKKILKSSPLNEEVKNKILERALKKEY
jgi:hypothetical protein